MTQIEGNYNLSPASEMPHNGKLLKKYVLKSGLKQKQIAERMGIKPQTLQNYYDNEKLHTQVLWRASLIFGVNLLFDLGANLPGNLASEYILKSLQKQSEQDNRVKQLEQENKELRIELAVYEKVLRGFGMKE